MVTPSVTSKGGWLGLDGEGIGRDPHRYVMLCCNDESGERADYIEDVNGLSTRDCLDWLLMLPDGHRVAGYYLSYDWTMILRDLPNKLLYRLLRPETRLAPRSEGSSFSDVRWQGYRLHYLSGMMRIKRGDNRVVIWDVGKFFQSRFVAALEQSGLAPTELIKRMKGERGGAKWDEDYLDTIRAYCLEECKYLASLCQLLESQHEAIDLHPKTWHGPGSTAKAAFRLHKVDEYNASPPKEVQQLAHCAYFGGRFEQSVIGHRANVKAYDVRSAYPFAMTTLPCLAHATWKHVRKLPAREDIALIRYHVRDIGERAWGPLPCRLEDGSIVWPRSGSSGWVWSVEYWPAVDGWSGVEYGGEAWVLQKHCVCKPFEYIPELYEWRVSRPENKQVVKLVLNAGYGSIAQTVGGGSKYSSRVWAGLITASCRARMLELITAHEDERNVYAIATDGLFSSELHDIDRAELGGWEVTDKGDMTFLRPGIYWAEKDIAQWYATPTETNGDRALKAVKARGIGRRQMLAQIEEAKRALERGDEKALLGKTTLFGGVKQTVYRTQAGTYKRSPLYGQWFESPATLSLKPQPKRDSDWRPPALGGVESQPYNHKSLSAEAVILKAVGQMLHARL